jgi:hypothetical protein
MSRRSAQALQLLRPWQRVWGVFLVMVAGMRGGQSDAATWIMPKTGTE